MVRKQMINKDLNDNENSVAAWIVKFLIKRNVKVSIWSSRRTYSTYLGLLL